jgi:ubiquinone/menaquinone biosynthesis C-methylase UbiE
VRIGTERGAAQRAVAPSNLSRELRDQLRTLPAFRALLRSVEAVLLGATAPWDRPILDLGCGDGDFGNRVLRGLRSVGLDPDLSSLSDAARLSGKRALVAGSATVLPLPTASIGTVLANSVLEHIPDLPAALSECARVLRPGGRLLLTSPSDRFRSLLATPSLLSALGLHGAARKYGRWFDRHSRHFHTWSEQKWRSTLEARGFRVLAQQSYVGERAHAVFEVLHYLGAPTVLFRRWTGRWVPWRNPLTHALAARLLAPLASTKPVAGGAYVFFVAERLE